jgi:hypothetical protein
MANITNIDFDKLIRQVLPSGLRKPKMIAFLSVILYPLKQLYTQFKQWENKSQYDIKYQSGCPAHLEKVINDIFDNTEKRIYIGPGNIPTRTYLRLRLADNPLYVRLRSANAPIYIYTRDAYLYGNYNFTVNVPDALNTIDTVYLTAVVNRYKRDSKTFIIKYFS